MSMNSTLLLAGLLLGGTLMAAYLRRNISDMVRVGIDLVLMSAITALLVYQGISPLLEATGPEAHTGGEFIRRAIAGGWWVIGARLLVGLLRVTLHRDRRTRETRLFSDLVAGAIYLVTAFIVLNSVLALPVRGVLATSGILAVVLGLALQNTLSDVFSGIAVGIEAPFKVDDRITIDGKVEGLVIQINWRSIRILTDSNDVAIFPNSVVAKAEIINRSFPSARRSGSVQIACASSASPERVTDMLLEAAMLCTGIEREPAPSVVLLQMKRTKNIYRLSFWAANSHALSSNQDQLIQRCHQQLYFAGLLPEDDRKQTMPHRPTAMRLADRRILDEMALFESLTDDEMERLAGALRSRLLKAGEQLFAEGSSDGTLSIVVAGVLEISHKVAVGEEILGHVGAGEYVGEIGLFTGDPHRGTATAATRCRVIQLAKDAVDPLIAENPDLAVALEEAVRHSMQLLSHSSAAHIGLRGGTTAQLLERIRSFFSPALNKPSP